MIGKILKRLFALLILLTATTVIATIAAIEGQWIWFTCTAIAWSIIFFSIKRKYRHNAQKVAFLFDSIDNGDQAFRYAERNVSSTDKMVNMSLNRIYKILFQAKAEIIQKEKYYELIMNSVNTGIVVIDDRGYVFQTNKEALRLLGINVFTHVSQLIQIDDTLAETVRNIHAGEKHQVSFSNERGTIHLLLQVSEMLLKDKLVRIIAMNDINNELDEKEIDSWIRLTRVLTHEIMNSITPITSLSETMITKHSNNSEVCDGLQVINTTGKGLISFVESYRRFTHIPTPKPELFYVEEFLERMKQLAYHQKNQPNINIEINVNPNDLLVYADESLTSQVVLNLLKNAFEAIENQDNGLIRINAYSNQSEAIIIEVINNGPSIPQEVKEHIFVPFFTTKEQGSGIGLSVSRQIMRLSGGSISLKNDEAGNTCFTITFP
jgi:Signal transduction histidine kinase involved in nitrogen fixation and metabolism regulation